MHIDANTGTALLIALLLAVEIIGLGAWGLTYGCRGRKGWGR